MKSVCIAIAVLALIGGASAECANACSGHGFCQINDQCNCYRNWQSADCSERTCPFDLAFVDTPQGDLDGDGVVTKHATAALVASGGTDTRKTVPWNVMKTWEYYPHDAADGEAHFYRECSNKGMCNRKSGECECFDGYEGVACKRTVCPNACSGHGTCESIKELGETSGWQPSVTYEHKDDNENDRMNAVLHASANVAGAASPYHASYAGAKVAGTGARGYDLWDQDKTFGCKCDEGYSGPDCSLRECPTGDDPLTASQADEVQTIDCTDDFTLIFTDTNGERWETDTITCNDFGADSDNSADVAAALTGLPNSVIEAVTMGAWLAGDVSTATTKYTVTFFGAAPVRGNSGDIPALECTGCVASGVVTTTDGTTESTTCSGRGLCDYATGVCKCFRGYTLDDCSQQNALAY